MTRSVSCHRSPVGRSQGERLTGDPGRLRKEPALFDDIPGGARHQDSDHRCGCRPRPPEGCRAEESAGARRTSDAGKREPIAAANPRWSPCCLVERARKGRARSTRIHRRRIRTRPGCKTFVVLDSRGDLGDRRDIAIGAAQSAHDGKIAALVGYETHALSGSRVSVEGVEGLFPRERGYPRRSRWRP
jgi:hypothetical protein